MRLVKGGLAVVASVGLTACQTINGMTVNGVSISPHPAQGETFCERNVVVCLVGGAAVAGGVALAAMGRGYHSNTVGMTGGGY